MSSDQSQTSRHQPATSSEQKPISYSAPRILGDQAGFWEAAKSGRFLIKRCKDCGKAHWFPRALCPFCMGETDWEEASGRGEIYTYSITRKALPQPFVIAYVTLDEGPRMMTHIVDCDPESVRIGQRVKLVFKPTEGDGPPLPMFCPASD
ncbi:MAG: Zn-ribbon domain-containing OB-fold protein [Betaproteobacteria bacterium]|nr:Zn-ribbon domain-containing OB-fold protein [Betaproteobacteria bacterium]